MATDTAPLTLEQIRHRKIDLPVCPDMLVRLSQVLGNSRSHVDEIVGVIQVDPTLISQILRVANSAAFGTARNILSIPQAVIRLGVDEIARIASFLLTKRLFQQGTRAWTPACEALWQHSCMTAVVARKLAGRWNPRMSDTFFTVGMLHDYAKTLLLQVAPGDYPDLDDPVAGHGEALLAWEQEHFGTSHTRLGGELLSYWGLPKTLVDLVAHHHRPREDSGQAGQLFDTANRLAVHLDEAGQTLPMASDLLRALSDLGIGKDVLAAFTQEAQAEMDKLDAMRRAGNAPAGAHHQVGGVDPPERDASGKA